MPAYVCHHITKWIGDHKLSLVPTLDVCALPLSLTLHPIICSLLLSHTQADLNKESTKDNLGVNIKKPDPLSH